VIASLDPLECLPQLKKLRFDAKKIEDGRVEPLAKLQQLAGLWLSSKQFSTRQFAWLRAHMPDSLHSDSLEPVWHPSKPIGDGEFPRDTLVVGKGKPWLNSVRDARRIERYVNEFRSMVEGFRRHPEMGPD
jgi:hypothetical protein